MLFKCQDAVIRSKLDFERKKERFIHRSSKVRKYNKSCFVTHYSNFYYTGISKCELKSGTYCELLGDKIEFEVSDETICDEIDDYIWVNYSLEDLKTELKCSYPKHESVDYDKEYDQLYLLVKIDK